MSFVDTLDQLLALQSVDSEIQALERSLAYLPKQVEQAQEEQSSVEAQAQEATDRVQAILKKRKELEGEIDACGQIVNKFEIQKLSVKTNAEFHAINAQIAHEKNKRSGLEDEVLASFDEEQSAQQNADNVGVKLAEAEKRTGRRKAELEAHAETDKKRLEELKASRERIAPGVANSTLQKYERMRLRNGGTAVVGVQRGTCGGCFTTLPPQLVNEVKKRGQLLFCEHCGRFLVHDPAADA